ncbi:MAG: AMP-binding protein, partial [Thermodesulfobacteriota bacterium]
MDSVSVNCDVMTPVRFIERAAAIFDDKTAVVYGNTRFTYQMFYERVNRLASALKAAGVQKGDKVAFICPNTPPMLEAHFAVPMIGAALVSVNIRLSSGEVGYILDHSEAKMVFVDNAFAELVSPIMDDLDGVARFVNICDVDDSHPLAGTDYESFLLTGSPEPVTCAVEDEWEVATINYTSGTTGKPKGVMYHHRGAFLNAMGEVIEFGLTDQSAYLWTLPMFHCNGWCFPWAVTAIGATHVCLRKVEPQTIYDVIEKEQVTHLCAAPTVLIGL